jgi:hypothetical protein
MLMVNSECVNAEFRMVFMIFCARYKRRKFIVLVNVPASLGGMIRLSAIVLACSTQTHARSGLPPPSGPQR